MRALVKLEQVLPAHLRRRLGALGSVTVALPVAGPTVDPQQLTAIAAACRDSECLRFGYRAAMARAAAARWSPTRSSTPAAAGISSPGIAGGRTGAPSAWTAWPGRHRPACASRHASCPRRTPPPTSSGASRPHQAGSRRESPCTRPRRKSGPGPRALGRDRAPRRAHLRVQDGRRRPPLAGAAHSHAGRGLHGPRTTRARGAPERAGAANNAGHGLKRLTRLQRSRQPAPERRGIWIIARRSSGAAAGNWWLERHGGCGGGGGEAWGDAGDGVRGSARVMRGRRPGGHEAVRGRVLSGGRVGRLRARRRQHAQPAGGDAADPVQGCRLERVLGFLHGVGGRRVRLRQHAGGGQRLRLPRVDRRRRIRTGRGQRQARLAPAADRDRRRPRWRDRRGAGGEWERGDRARQPGRRPLRDRARPIDRRGAVADQADRVEAGLLHERQPGGGRRVPGGRLLVAGGRLDRRRGLRAAQPLERRDREGHAHDPAGRPGPGLCRWWPVEHAGV